jgi:hypothetical protein
LVLAIIGDEFPLHGKKVDEEIDIIRKGGGTIAANGVEFVDLIAEIELVDEALGKKNTILFRK